MRKSIATAAAAGIALAGVTALQGGALASPEPRDVAVATMLAAKTSPAVQAIGLDYTGTVMVPQPVPTKAFEELFAKAERHAEAGRLPADQQSQLKWVLRTAAKNVTKYLVPGKTVEKATVSTGSTCTGWWITPDGYMVTGQHCVAQPDAQVRELLADAVLPKAIKGNQQSFLKQMSKFAQPDDAMAQLAENLFTSYHHKNVRLTGVKREHRVAMQDADGAITIRNLNLVAEGSRWPGEDFALLKMEEASGLPTLSLGNDDDVRVGDHLYISGFPGITMLDPGLDPRSKFYPSLTDGAYNVKRTSTMGVPYLQVQAPAYGGNSGGPVFGEDGKVVGMLIAGPQLDGGTAETASYVLPVSIIRKKLAAAGARPVLAETSQIYDSALEDFFAGRYETALDKFHQVQELYPAHPYVGGFIADAKKALR